MYIRKAILQVKKTCLRLLDNWHKAIEIDGLPEVEKEFHNYVSYICFCSRKSWVVSKDGHSGSLLRTMEKKSNRAWRRESFEIATSII